MTTPSWPESLPQKVLVQGYQESIGDGRRKSGTDTGPGKVFRKTSAMPRPLNASVNLTGTQLEVFLSFWETDLDGGALPFNLPDPRGDSTILVRFAENAPSWTASSATLFNVSLPLEVLP